MISKVWDCQVSCSAFYCKISLFLPYFVVLFMHSTNSYSYHAFYLYIRERIYNGTEAILLFRKRGVPVHDHKLKIFFRQNKNGITFALVLIINQHFRALWDLITWPTRFLSPYISKNGILFVKYFSQFMIMGLSNTLQHARCSYHFMVYILYYIILGSLGIFLYENMLYLFLNSIVYLGCLGKKCINEPIKSTHALLQTP